MSADLVSDTRARGKPQTVSRFSEIFIFAFIMIAIGKACAIWHKRESAIKQVFLPPRFATKQTDKVLFWLKQAAAVVFSSSLIKPAFHDANAFVSHQLFRSTFSSRCPTLQICHVNTAISDKVFSWNCRSFVVLRLISISIGWGTRCQRGEVEEKWHWTFLSIFSYK